MNAQSPSAYACSAILHGLFVAAVVLSALALKQANPSPTAEVFEMVAGEGDNYAATEAPARGTENGVRFDSPEAKPMPPLVIPPAPEPVVSAPPPSAASPVQAVEPPKEAPKKPEPPVDFARTIQRTAKQSERKVVNKHQREQAAIAKAEAKAAAEEKKRVTKEEFDRQNAKKLAQNSKTPGKPVPFERINARGLAGGVEGGTTNQPGAGGKVLSREEKDKLKSYFELLKIRLREAHQKPDSVSELLEARVEIFVASNGAVGNARIVKSSGDAEFDQSVLQACRMVRSIGPRPDGQSDSAEVLFRMKED